MAFMSTLGQFVAWMWLYKFIQNEGKDRGSSDSFFVIFGSCPHEKAGAPEAKSLLIFFEQKAGAPKQSLPAWFFS